MIKFIYLFEDIDFQLISKYIYIEGNNVLKTKSAIDRDLYEFTSINGILNLWAKVYTTANPTNLNYFKVNEYEIILIIQIKFF